MKAETALLLPLLLLSGSVRADEPSVLTAESRDPVSRETMGGCSMKCVFKRTTTAQSKGEAAPLPVKALNDEEAETSWKDESGGVGAKLALHFPAKIDLDMEGKIPFYGFEFVIEVLEVYRGKQCPTGHFRSAAYGSAWNAAIICLPPEFPVNRTIHR